MATDNQQDETLGQFNSLLSALVETIPTADSVLFVNSDGQITEDNTNLNFDGMTLTVPGVATSTSTMGETTDPGVASENEAVLYVTNVAGSTALHVRFPAGDSRSQQIAIEQ